LDSFFKLYGSHLLQDMEIYKHYSPFDSNNLEPLNATRRVKAH
jgi:hypothetical protein